MNEKGTKAVVIGAGQVGAATAYTLMLTGLVSELVIIDLNQNKARGEALDIAHGMPLCPPAEVYAGDYPDCAGADIVIITAGANQKPGETRLDLLAKNCAVFGSIVPKAVEYAPDALYLVVTNPVDALTLETIRLSGLPAGRVIGTGTVLDTSRLRYLLSQHTGIDPRNIHAFVLGEHGDSEFVAWSRARIAGMTLDEYCADCGRCKGPISAILDSDIENQVRRAAYSIIELKGATYYAIAVAVRRIVEAILRDEQSILTVSTLLEGQYGLDGVCLSVPAIVGRKGVERVLEVGLDDDEKAALTASAKAITTAMADRRQDAGR